MKYNLKRLSGKWTINGKVYSKMNPNEQNFYSSFLKYMKEAHYHEQARS